MNITYNLIYPEVIKRISEQKGIPTDHLHYDDQRTWLERDMCAHQDLSPITCEVSNMKEFICNYCGISNPNIKPEPRSEEWYRTMVTP